MWRTTSPLGERDVKVVSGPGLCHDHPIVEGVINSKWASMLQSNPTLFSGAKFRLSAVKGQREGEGGAAVTLQIGLTNYKEYVGTHCPDESAFALLREEGRKRHDNPEIYLSLALGCQCLVITADDMMLFMRRSEKVATFKGW